MRKGMIQNREAFLDHVAKGLGRERRKTGVRRPDWRHQPQSEVFAGYSQDELLDVLKNAGKAIHTDIRETKVGKLPNMLDDTIKVHGGGPVVTSNDPRFLGFGLGLFLKRDDVHVWDPPSGKENIDIAEKANVGVTFSDKTLAESGSVALFSDKGKGRSISLLPKTYIAIIPKSTIVPRITQAARDIHQKVEAGESVASCVNFVSGPSNSADIELNLVVGVHGPVQATYIVVTDR